MIHANSLPFKGMTPQQFVQPDILDVVCEKVKLAANEGHRRTFLDYYKFEMTKATEQILTLYGYRIDSVRGCYFMIEW
jgi:hypothetical protein